MLGDAQVRHLQSADVITGFRPDGLFARIMCMLNAIRLGEALGKPARYLWEEFDTSAPGPHGYDDDWRVILRDNRIVGVPPTLGGPWPDNANLRTSLPALLSGETLPEVTAELQRIARGLRLADGRLLGASLAPGTYTWGLHARQGDSAQLRFSITKYFPESGWLQLLDQLLSQDPDGVAFVASDEPRLLAEAAMKNGARVRVAHDVIPPRLGKLAADFAEALQLAQARNLIAPRQSAFSMFAGLVSGAPAETPEAVLGIQAIVEELVSVALRSYENDLGAALLLLDELGADTTSLASKRRALLAAGALLRGRPGGAGHKDANAVPRHPATRDLKEPGDASEDTPSQHDILALLRLLTPRESTRGKVRLGADHLGGYVVADDLDGIAGAISIGVVGDGTFDLALAERGIPVLLVDPTVVCLPTSHPLVTHDRRVWAARTQDGSVNLADLVERLDKLTGRPGADLLLKVEAEGSEWEALSGAQSQLLRRFRVITMGLHGLTALRRPGRLRVIQRRLSTLKQDHEVMHLHANNGGRVAWVHGVPLASDVNVSMLRRDRAAFKTEPVRIPGPLDHPIDPERPDLVWTPFSTATQSNLVPPSSTGAARTSRHWWFSRRQ